MVDDSAGVCATLQVLYLHAQTKGRGSETAKAALGAELTRLLYKAAEPDEGAREFLVNIMFETAMESGDGAARVDAMAFRGAGTGPGKEHLENKRAAGIVHVTRSSHIVDGAKRKEALKADAADRRLDPYARNLAGVLLMKMWREEQRQNTDYGFYREAMEFMNNEDAYLRPTRVEVAKFILDFCIKADKAFPVAGEIATSGKWPELADEAGRWPVEQYISTGDVGMAKRIADAPGTTQNVKDYAAKRFGEIGFRPIERDEKKTLTGMPAWRPPAAPVREVRGVPPSPEALRHKITIRGPVR